MSVTMYSRLWFTFDDRGQKIRLRAYSDLQGRVATGSATDVMIDRATNLYASTMPTKTVGVLIGLVIPIIMLVGLQIGWWAAFPMVAIPIAIMLIVNRNVLRKIHIEMADVFAGEGVCAGCAYPLGGLESDGSGHLVCPECSAAWDRSRVIRFAEVSKRADSPARQWLRRVVGHVGGHGPRSIHDDRDVFRTAASMQTIRRALRANSDGTRDDRFQRAQRNAGRVGRVARLWIAFIFVLVILLHIWSNAHVLSLGGGRSGIDVSLISITLLMPAMFSVFIVVILRGDTGRKGSKIQSALLAESLCPSCVADLAAIDPQSDGGTVCPECGGTWKLGDAD